MVKPNFVRHHVYVIGAADRNAVADLDGAFEVCFVFVCLVSKHRGNLLVVRQARFRFAVPLRALLLREWQGIVANALLRATDLLIEALDLCRVTELPIQFALV